MTRALAILLVVLVAGCVRPPVIDPDRASAFDQRLAQEYFALAEAEFEESDFADGRAFADKMARAARGEAVAPDDLADRDLAAEARRALESALADLRAVLSGDAALIRTGCDGRGPGGLRLLGAGGGGGTAIG